MAIVSEEAYATTTTTTAVWLVASQTLPCIEGLVVSSMGTMKVVVVVASWYYESGLPPSLFIFH